MAPVYRHWGLDRLPSPPSTFTPRGWAALEAPRPPRPILTAAGTRIMQAGWGRTPQEAGRGLSWLRPLFLGFRHYRYSIAFACSPLAASQAAGRWQQGAAGPAAAQLKTELVLLDRNSDR